MAAWAEKNTLTLAAISCAYLDEQCSFVLGIGWCLDEHKEPVLMLQLGLARTIYTRCMYGTFCRDQSNIWSHTAYTHIHMVLANLFNSRTSLWLGE
jgi:hypothetical protein